MHHTHTPGPWSVGRAPHGHCRIYSEAETHAIARTYGPDLNGIGVCRLTGPQNVADARLISAAPEMLAVLEAFVEAMGDGSRDAADRLAVACRAAIPVIAKAKGSGQ